MKRKKRILSILSASALMLSAIGYVPHNTNADWDDYDYYYDEDYDPYPFNFPTTDDDVENQWRYSVLDSFEGICDTQCVELTAYIGDCSTIVIPSEINGLPVVSVKKHLIPQYFYDRIEIYVPDSIQNFEDEWVIPTPYFRLFNQQGDEYMFTTHYQYDFYHYEDENYYSFYDDYSNSRLYFTLLYCHDRRIIDIPEKCLGFYVDEVSYGALSGCYLAKEVTIPDTVRYMSKLSSGYDYYGIKKLKLPKHLNYLPKGFFEDMPELEEVIFPEDLLFMDKNDIPEGISNPPSKDKLWTIIDQSFYSYEPFHVFDYDTNWCYYIYPIGKSGKPEVYLVYAPDINYADLPTKYRGYEVQPTLSENPPAGVPVIHIDKSTKYFNVNYSDTSSLEKLIIDSNDLVIESPGISGSQIKELSFPGSAELCNSCFLGSNKLESVAFTGENSWIEINRCAFYFDSLLSNLTFPKECTKLIIGELAFQEIGIEELELPDGTVTLEASAFRACKNLKDVHFKDGITIEKYAFKDCRALKNITFDGSAEMDRDVFENCISLKNINLDITKPINTQCFSGCTALETINGESPFNEDGSPKAEYKDFIEKNFYDADNNGIINKYVEYRVKKMVAETVTDDMTDMQKIKALHDKLGEMVYYDTENVALEKNHNDASVFLNESSVCDGYARAMNLLLHEAGIRSCYVNNPDHAWVVVELGGHYFHVDPTWDDVGDIIYDWFMKTDDQIMGDPMHSTWNIKAPTVMHSFQWRNLPRCTEKMGDVNHDDIIDGRDASDILAGYAKASVGEECDLDPVLADFDYSGSVTAADASKVLKEYAEVSVEQ